MMRALSTIELINLWERGLTQTSLERALALLTATSPDVPLPALAEMSVGRRDARLLTLRETLFGPELNCLADCPVCSERLEVNFSVNDIRTQDVIDADQAPESNQTLTLKEAGYELSFRIPNSLDLAAVGDSADVTGARSQLFERCLLKASHKGQDKTAAQLPDRIIEKVAKRMADADPQANVELDLTCPTCGHRWPAAFDIVSYLWSELHAWALRILRETHLLASAYGWREAEILTMSPLRRQFYLEMVSR